MALVYSQRLFAISNLTPVGKVGPVVPAGVVWVVRDIDIVCTSFTPGDELAIFNQVGGYLLFLRIPASPTIFDNAWRGRQIYATGEQVAVESFVGAWDVAISGYQLTLP
ncbi:MAG: hypothetical protein WAL64_10955 [Candidatus Dormiibacterota bacterium]